MKRLIYAILLIVALLAAMLIAPQVVGDKGYVLISMGTVNIEMTVVSLCISLLVVGIGSWILWRFISRLFGLVSGSRNWFGGLSRRKRQRKFYRGFHALAEGDLEGAKKAFQDTTDGDFDGVNYLAAAQVAHALNEPDRVALLLERAAEYDNAKVAACIVLARNDLAQGKQQRALDRLNELDEKAAQHPQVIRLKARAMGELGQWQTLQEQLPQWRKPLKEDYVTWAQTVAKGKFAEIASKQGANALRQYWQKLPRKMRNDDAYRAAYAQQLLEQGMHKDAEACLVEWQKKGPHAVLLPLMAQISMPNPTAAIALLEKWIKQDSENPALYSTLGHVAFNAGDDALAEKVLLKAVKLQENQRDLMALAEISERRHNDAQALSLYKRGFAAE
ncbi:heme biosynthesis HemY N-terminal domain-containing protein [Aestuariibacter sp. A3R04]|uniref:heme biosynthesis HemY N-terminal domain-containing protein n=1 Tax=Aestuariibacter sp. A3R04 TaxID=2841571 RepID=UPI001C098409|nr:heme biosynthesis HemY N-terminal domain-containing protein [Aestuariibacter sp. A3R04]MBU3023714.1 heme biosynthesis protein [Aestuariibacter sp. A3R04]